jgi:nucleoside-diphosphate-sugar epimerase
VIAITGARGYLGAALCHALSRSGHRVRRLTRAPDGACGDAFFSLGEGCSDGALAGVETLIHAAHDFRPRREDELRRVNVEGSRRLFAAARGAGVRRILFISSLASWAGARAAYGRVKWTLEQEVASHGGASIRPGTVFGVDKGGMFAALDRAVHALPLLPDFGARARLYAVHRDDLIDVVKAWLACDDQNAPRLIPAAHPEPLTLRRVLEATATAAGRAPRFIRIPAVPALAGLRLLESAGFAVPFRSDGLISILHANPTPGLAEEVLGVRLRRLEPRTINE